MGHIIVYVCCCNLCSHTWLSAREELPNRCAKCKSTHWDRTLGERASEEEKARASEPLELETIAVRDIKTDDLELEEESETIPVQTIAKDTPVETPKPAKRTKRPVATPKQASKGLRMCRHGFAIVDGITMCKACA